MSEQSNTTNIQRCDFILIFIYLLGIWDELSDSMQRTGISDNNRSKPKQNSQLDTPDVSMEQSKSSRMNNLNK